MEKQKTIAWAAPEFVHYEKNIGWYITLAALSILLIGFFVIVQNDIFAAVTIGIIAVIVMLFAQVVPRTVNIHLTGKGVQIENIIFPYKQLKHFWIVYTDHHKTINFDAHTYLNRTIIVQLHDQDPEEIRRFLLQHLPEHHETGETLAQRVIHKFKF